MNRDDIRITIDAGELSSEQLVALYVSVGFGTWDSYEGMEGDLVHDLFPSGVYGFFAWHDQALIGLARAFSDDSTCTWLAEVCVRPASQRQGVGQGLIEAVLRRFSHTAIYLEAFREHEEFFARNGIPKKFKLVACARAATARND